MDNLRKKAVSGVLWSAILKFGQEGISFVVKLALARVLMPEEFGLIAMISVFISISGMIAQGGFGFSLVQSKELSNTDIETVFSINLLIGLLMACVLWVTAPWISLFYGQEELTQIMRVLCFVVFIRQLGSVHSALFSRDMDYKQVAIASFPGLILSGIVGVWMAIEGYGVWALVTQTILSAIFSAAFKWYFSPWSPSLGISTESAKRLFPFGAKLMLNRFLNILFNNIYILVIGRYYSAAELAFYQRAKGLQSLPVTSVFEIFNRVAFPLISRASGDQERAQLAFKKMLLYLSWIIFPGMALLAAVGEPLIVVLIKEKWLPAVPYLQVLCCMGFVMTINMLNMNMMQGCGRAGLVLKISVANKMLTIVNIFFMIQHGIMAMIVGQLVVGLITNVVNILISRKVLNVPIRLQLNAIYRPVMSSFLVALLVMPVVNHVPTGAFLQLLSGLLLGGTVWWFSLFMFRAEMQHDLRLLCEQYPVLARFVKISGMLRPV
jgi:O-antigen/teichoic acid export membrane protein